MKHSALKQWVLTGIRHHDAAMGRGGIQWVQPRDVQDGLLTAARVESAKLELGAAAAGSSLADHSETMYDHIEKPLGVPKGDWGTSKGGADDSLIQAVFRDTQSVRMAVGNEGGVNDMWQPGGFSGSPDLDLDLWKREAILSGTDVSVKNIEFLIVYENGKFITPPKPLDTNEVTAIGQDALAELSKIANRNARLKKFARKKSLWDGVVHVPSSGSSASSGSMHVASLASGSAGSMAGGAVPAASAGSGSAVHVASSGSGSGTAAAPVTQVCVRFRSSKRCTLTSTCKSYRYGRYPVCKFYSGYKDGFCVRTKPC